MNLHADDPAGGQRHRRQGQDGGLQPPQPETVDHGEAHPDGEERHRLPLREQPHRDQVEPDEDRPGDVGRDRAELVEADQALSTHDQSLPPRLIRVNRA
jgi:hypothetical protein